MWTCVRFPNYHEPTGEELELIRILQYSHLKEKDYLTVLSLIANEAEESDSDILDLSWLGWRIYKAGEVRGVQKERARRKGEGADK